MIIYRNLEKYQGLKFNLIVRALNMISVKENQHLLLFGHKESIMHTMAVLFILLIRHISSDFGSVSLYRKVL